MPFSRSVAAPAPGAPPLRVSARRCPRACAGVQSPRRRERRRAARLPSWSARARICSTGSAPSRLSVTIASTWRVIGPASSLSSGAIPGRPRRRSALGGLLRRRHVAVGEASLVAVAGAVLSSSSASSNPSASPSPASTSGRWAGSSMSGGLSPPISAASAAAASASSSISSRSAGLTSSALALSSGIALTAVGYPRR